jgi:hypothetical protein
MTQSQAEPTRPKPFGLAPWLAGTTILCLTAAVYFAGRERGYVNELERLRGQMREQTVSMTRQREAFGILGAPDAIAISTAHGQLWIGPRSGVVLLASGLAPAPEGQSYRMWLIAKNGGATPAGSFRGGESTVLHVHRGPVDVSATRAITVTLEHDGAAAPSPAPPVIDAPLPAERR